MKPSERARKLTKGGEPSKKTEAERDKLKEELEGLKSGHCRDCCCARSWEALGISEYTGKSIPEEIYHLIEGMAVAQDLAADMRDERDRLREAIGIYTKQAQELMAEIARLREALEKIADVQLDSGGALEASTYAVALRKSAR